MAVIGASSRAGVLLFIGAFLLSFSSQGVSAKCTKELFKKGTGRRADGCPEPAHGMYSRRERQLITDLYPVVSKFTAISNFAELKDEEIGVRDYLKKKLRPLVASLGSLRCRCEKSILAEFPASEDLGLDNLQMSLIEPLNNQAEESDDNPTAYKLLQDWLKKPDDEDNSAALASWFGDYSVEFAKLRCAPTFQEARRNTTGLTQVGDDKTCRQIYRARGKRVSVSRVICPKGTCPNFEEDF